jgi:pyruvate formate lyase activating enzyme
MNAASSKKESPPKPATPLTPRIITSIELEAPGYSEPCIGGMVPFSSVDWPHRLATALFLAGCPWRCHYCHNPHLQTRTGCYSWSKLLEWLGRRRGLLEGVVFSVASP